MATRTSRRQFLKTSAVAGVGFWIAGTTRTAESSSPNGRIRFACVGVSGKGKEDTADAAKVGDIVAICDIDDTKLAEAAEKYPDARQFSDWRKMLDEMSGGFDAITVSTPDHQHAVVAAAAMRLGKHAFVQKPLTRTIHEARALGEIARANNVATQMGNQHTANSTARRAAALVRESVLGPVKEIHVWTNRPIWPQGLDRPEEKPVPSTVHWDLFLGPAPERPYTDTYHPFKWRGWWDFGSGALGDMACHTMNMPFMALDLRNPTTVQAETSGHNHDSFPSRSRITYEFAATNRRPAVKMVWYDGGMKPERDLFDREIPARGCLIIGEKGNMLAPGDYAGPSKDFAEFSLIGVDPIDVQYPESPGHVAEFVRAIRGGEAAMSNFPDYAGPLTEMVLLGNLAVWAADQPDAPGKKIEWDWQAMQAKGMPELDALITPKYRGSYTL